MKRTTVWIAALVVLGAVLPLLGAGWDPGKEEGEIEKAKQAVAAMKRADPGLKTFFDKAYGFVVFAEVGKGAFIVGGAHGKGVVWERGKMVGGASVTKVSIGAQVGGMTYSEIIFFKDKTTMDKFKAGTLEFAATAAAVIVKNGASADAAYSNGVAVFIMGAKGAMVDASVGGQKFSFVAGK